MYYFSTGKAHQLSRRREIREILIVQFVEELKIDSVRIKDVFVIGKVMPID